MKIIFDSIRISAIFISLLTFLILFQQPAQAHETRKVAGKYEMTVGFLNEPAFTGEMNAAVFLVTSPSSKNSRPVFKLEQSLKASIIFNDKMLPVELTPLRGEPGAYAGYFLPTRSGKYIFQIEGDIEGNKISERFETKEVTASGALQFPDKIGEQSTGEFQPASKKPGQFLLIAFAGIILSVVALILAFFSFVAKNNKPNFFKS